MDWSRAKTILVIAFMLLNLLLGYQLWYDRAGTSGAAQENREEEQAFEQIITQKNIEIQVQLPQETPKLREMTVKMTPPDGQPGMNKLPAPFEVSVLRDRSALSETLSKVIPDAESYELSPVDSGNTRYVFHQMQNGYPLFDIKLELYTSDGQVNAFRQLHAEPLTGALHKEQKVLSALTAVSILADKYLQEGTDIIDVRLGYHGQAFNSETRVLAPFWRVVTEKGEQYFVHAITGAVE